MIKSWSYSRLKIFEQCPYRAHLQFTEKRPDSSDKTAADRGTIAHADAERFVKGEGPLTKDMKKFADDFKEVAELYQNGRVELEGEWGFDNDWQPCDYWGDDVWLRVKLDQFIWTNNDRTRAEPVDLKTGKKFGNEVSHSQQGQIYTLAAFLRFPELEVCDTKFKYLDQGPKHTTKKTFTRERAMKFLPIWDKRARKMTEATEFPPRPNKITCRFCPYGTKTGDGSCEWAVDCD